MAKKSIACEMTGTKSPRQHTWEAIRQLNAMSNHPFTRADVADLAGLDQKTVNDYFRALTKAGFITVVDSQKVNSLCAKNEYRLTINNGIEAPRISKSGVVATEGTSNERMWGTMRRLFIGQDFNCHQLAAFASTPTSAVSEATARRFMWFLHSAKYLECTARQKKGQTARFRFRPEMDTGSRPPMIQLTNTVIDQNLNKIVWEEKKGEEDDLV